MNNNLQALLVIVVVLLVLVATMAFAVWVFVAKVKDHTATEKYWKEQAALARAKEKESLVGKIMQFSIGSWPSYWKIVEVAVTGELLLRCVRSPFGFKQGNWKKGDEVIIPRAYFREYKPAIGEDITD